MTPGKAGDWETRVHEHYNVPPYWGLRVRKLGMARFNCAILR